MKPAREWTPYIGKEAEPLKDKNPITLLPDTKITGGRVKLRALPVTYSYKVR